MSQRRRKGSRDPRVSARAWPRGRRASHAVLRTCAGCGERGARGEMHRLGRSLDGGLEWRDDGGRGTYLHPNAECENLFVKSRRPLRGLRMRPDEAARQELLNGKAARA